MGKINVKANSNSTSHENLAYTIGGSVLGVAGFALAASEAEDNDAENSEVNSSTSLEESNLGSTTHVNVVSEPISSSNIDNESASMLVNNSISDESVVVSIDDASEYEIIDIQSQNYEPEVTVDSNNAVGVENILANIAIISTENEITVDIPESSEMNENIEPGSDLLIADLYEDSPTGDFVDDSNFTDIDINIS